MEPVTPLRQPVILISGGSATSASVQAAATLIASAGAVPLILSDHVGRVRGKDLHEEVKRIMQKADGLMVMGNNGDIDPSEYGEPKDSKTNSELVTKDAAGNETVNEEGMARRNYETALMRMAIEIGMPMFGVCGGMQRFNVLCGGKLHQHVPDQMRDAAHNEHEQQKFGIPPYVPVQPVIIKNGTTLASIAEEINMVYTPARTAENDMKLNVNSMHHQAVSKLGAGLRAAATSEDVLKDGSKLIEAMEIDPDGPLGDGPLGKKRFGIFTQWHPEFSDSPIGTKIANHFTAAVLEFAKATGREHTLEEVQEENRISALHVVKPATPDMTVRPESMVDRILKQYASRQPAAGISI